MATMYPEQEHLAALDVETARLENALAASNAALDELREQQEGQEDALRGAAQTMREAKELDDACCVTIEGLRSENARLNGMLLLERDRDEVNRAKHGDILRAKAREADTARAASEAREEALDARLAKLRDSIVRATALVAEKDALRATNAQRHDVNADMAALIRSGSVCVHRVPSCTLTPPPSHTPLTPPPSLLPSTKPAGTLLTS
jgi:hypothetical protein|tara:strand:- start:193 stop:810 length:618 start_codon:yes stop_codon:yes gene_type:complete